MHPSRLGHSVEAGLAGEARDRRDARYARRAVDEQPPCVVPCPEDTARHSLRYDGPARKATLALAGDGSTAPPAGDRQPGGEARTKPNPCCGLWGSVSGLRGGERFSFSRVVRSGVLEPWEKEARHHTWRTQQDPNRGRDFLFLFGVVAVRAVESSLSGGSWRLDTGSGALYGGYVCWGHFMPNEVCCSLEGPPVSEQRRVIDVIDVT